MAPRQDHMPDDAAKRLAILEVDVKRLKEHVALLEEVVARFHKTGPSSWRDDATFTAGHTEEFPDD